MAQKTFVAGDVLTAADVNTYLSGEGGAWTTWNATITQSGTVTYSGAYGRYARFGRLIICQAEFDITGTGTGANAVKVSLPVNAANVGQVCGNGYVYDSSAGFFYYGDVVTETASTIYFLITTNGAAATFLGTTSFTAGLANGDEVNLSLMYEAAS